MTTPRLLSYAKKLDKKIMIGGQPDETSGKVWFYDIGGESNISIDYFNKQLNKVFFPTNEYIRNLQSVWRGGSIHRHISLSRLMMKDIKKMKEELEVTKDKERRKKLEDKIAFYEKHVHSRGRIVYQYYTTKNDIYLISNKNISLVKHKKELKGRPSQIHSKVMLKSLSSSDKFALVHVYKNKYALYVLNEDGTYQEVVTDLGNPISITFRGLKKNQFTNIYPEGFGNTNINKFNHQVIVSSRFLGRITRKNVKKTYSESMRKSRKHRN